MKLIFSLLFLFSSAWGAITTNDRIELGLSKNYITNGGIERGLAGYKTFADAAGTQPVDGTGGSALISIAASQTSPFNDKVSLVFAKTAVNAQGSGFSYDFTIDSGDQASMMQIKFDYAAVSGTYPDDEIGVWIYDITNATLIQPSTATLKNALIKVPYVGSFQTASNSTSYRLIFHVKSTATSSYSLKFDGFSIGKSKTTVGAFVGANQSYTPVLTNFGNATGINFEWKQETDNLVGKGTIRIGSSLPTGSIAFSLPGGLSMLDDASTSIGKCTYTASGSGATYVGSLFRGSATTINMRGGDGNSIWNATTPVTMTTNSEIYVEFRVKISGWSSSMILSSDSDEGRLITSTAYRKTSNQTVGTSATEVIFNASDLDRNSSFNLSSGRFYAKQSGDFICSSVLRYITGATAPTAVAAFFLVNGAGTRYGFYYKSAHSVNDSVTASMTDIIPLKAGDYVSVFVETTTATVDIQSTGTTNHASYFSASKISGNQTIAASESVVLIRSTQSNSIPNATETTLSFANAIEDSHSGWNASTHEYTIPIPGIYEIFCEITYDVISTESMPRILYVYKNASLIGISAMRDFANAAGSIGDTAAIQTTVTRRFLAGEKVKLTTAHYNSSASSKSLKTNSLQNRLVIKKVGN